MEYIYNYVELTRRLGAQPTAKIFGENSYCLETKTISCGKNNGRSNTRPIQPSQKLARTLIDNAWLGANSKLRIATTLTITKNGWQEAPR